jgi:hypothetical protein
VACGSGLTCSPGTGCMSAPTPPTSQIYFEECALPAFCGGSPYFELSAAFVAPPGPAGCTVTTLSGACSYFANCAQATPTYVSAGALTISGGSIPAGTKVTPETIGDYFYDSGGTLFTGGQTVFVAGSGSVVPAFGVESLVAPPAASLTSPAIASGNFKISTSAALSVAWTGGQAGATFFIEGFNDAANASFFYCQWDGGASPGTVPQSILAGLAGQSGSLSFGQTIGSTFSAGSYSIDLEAMEIGMGTVNFQ